MPVSEPAVDVHMDQGMVSFLPPSGLEHVLDMFCCCSKGPPLEQLIEGNAHLGL